MDVKRERFLVDSLDKFKSTINDIKSKYPEKLLVYRGQTKDWKLISSAKRRPAHCCIDRILTEGWYKFGEIILKKFNLTLNYKKKKDFAIVEAINQHYGWISKYLDITLDPLVALYFAVCKSRKKDYFSMLEDAYEDPYLRRTFQYDYIQNPNEYGYVYVLSLTKGLENSNNTHFIDLTKYMPSSAKRVHNQKAASLEDTKYTERIEGNYYDYYIPDMICALLKVDPKKMFKEICENYPLESLFPPAKEDEFYQHYLMIPQFVSFVEEFLPVATPIIDIPIYCLDSREYRSFGGYSPKARSNIFSYILGNSILEKKFPSPPCKSLKKTVTIRNASSISIDYELMFSPRFSEKKIILNFENLDFSSWRYNNNPLHNLFFEFNPSISFFYNFNFDFQCEAVRGLWVFIETENKFWVTRITEECNGSLNRGPLAFNGLTYWEFNKKRGLQRLNHKVSCPCKSESHLEDALNFLIPTNLLSNEKGFLKMGKNTLHFIPDPKEILERFKTRY